MTDWRQIRARIRRAKTGPDAATRLEQLYDKTRDGMVAFELAQLEEVAGRIERATDWYKRAWQRFRRSEWKQKAEEALARHGIPLPPELAEEPGEHAAAGEVAPATAEQAAEPGAEREEVFEAEGEAEPEAEANGEAEVKTAAPGEPAPALEAGAPRRRRRRRGGRGRGRGKGRVPAPQPVEAEAPAAPHIPPRPTVHVPTPRVREKEPERRPVREHVPPIHIYRRGEPALASEIKSLEAKLRQLLAAHPYQLEQVNELPSSPGVFLVSDLDLTTMYYLESCGNMRAAMEQLSSGRRGRDASVRTRLARYLGISDAQAGRYLKQHGVVRWIEMEESDAIALGHFAAALLRPELMEENS